MIVCHCTVVSDRDVREAADRGARSLSEVCARTGAGKNCGLCVLSVKRVLCQHQTGTAPLEPEVEVAAS